jgi:hypothetical protein
VPLAERPVPEPDVTTVCVMTRVLLIAGALTVEFSAASWRLELAACMVRLKLSPFAIGLWPAGAGESGLRAELRLGVAPGAAVAVGHRVVGHNAFDGWDAEGGEVGATRCGKLAPVPVFSSGWIRRGQAGVIVDRGVHVFVAEWGAGAGLVAFEAAAAVDASATTIAQPADLLDVDMQQFAGRSRSQRRPVSRPANCLTRSARRVRCPQEARRSSRCCWCRAGRSAGLVISHETSRRGEGGVRIASARPWLR